MLKGWSVVLVSALFALASKDARLWFIILAYFPALMFWVLDGYFLWQERLFRKLYDKVRQQQYNSIDFSMNTAEFVGDETWGGAMWSKTLRIFHLVVIATILVVMVGILVYMKG